tara:strand:+ start:517 stop:867 length:351 start_codon:yes stop_codon:yes gene_type:complete
MTKYNNAWMVEFWSVKDKEWEIMVSYPSTKLVSLNDQVPQPLGDVHDLDIGEVRASHAKMIYERLGLARYRVRYGHAKYLDGQFGKQDKYVFEYDRTDVKAETPYNRQAPPGASLT